ncbi:MAG: hypothetical protein RR772_07170 [Gordonibacter sp.]
MGSRITGITPKEAKEAIDGYIGEHIELIERASVSDIALIAKETVADLRETSPEDEFGKNRHYRNGWRMKSFAGPASANLNAAIVYNATKPSLCHLLEHGHAGPMPAAAYPHIEPAFNRAKARMDARFK